MKTRVALAMTGAALGAYGGWLLLSRQDLADWVEVGIWFAAGVVLHDFVLSPGLLAAGALVRGLPVRARSATVVGLVVLGSVTLLAVPVLGGFGVKSDNPTLFDRPYLGGWAVLAGLVLAAVVAAAVGRRGTTGGGRSVGAGPGR